MEIVIGLVIFGASWWALNMVFSKVAGRTMGFFEGLFYPVALALFGAWVISQLGPSEEERFSRDVKEYGRLEQSVETRERAQQLLEACIRERRTSDPDCQAAQGR
ncbi:hypothetical protein SRS16CHR_03594 [Variovorax sp. SRS16]|uniref:hypothetical protein n=1 Tax=Variovorax sp. SRS16 TaxID=282217 RepID=UPI0013173384|nr:hypothetical protein [Variovorax sp. SRS16]VTU25109.1 hypothetical protein SRS16CHR_03594 [Variovorax sp. SRS16]